MRAANRVATGASTSRWPGVYAIRVSLFQEKNINNPSLEPPAWIKHFYSPFISPLPFVSLAIFPISLTLRECGGVGGEEREGVREFEKNERGKEEELHPFAGRMDKK